MTQHLLNLSKFFSENHGINLSQSELEMINESVLVSNQQKLQQIEEKLCQSQRINCGEAVIAALEKYHHAGMSLEEVKKIVLTVSNHRAESPNITDTVRFLLVGP